MKHKRTHFLLIAGCGALVIAIALSAVLNNDLAQGVSFGVAIGLLLLAVYSIAKSKATSA